MASSQITADRILDATKRALLDGGYGGAVDPRVGVAFLGAETMILLGVDEQELPDRSALRKVAALIRSVEE